MTSELTPEVQYVCPACHGELSASADRYQCAGCNRDWLVEHGVPRFGDRELFWSVFDKDIAEEVAAYSEFFWLNGDLLKGQCCR